MKLTIYLFVLLASLSSCKKLVDVDAPVTTSTGESVYRHNSTAAAVLTGIYTSLSAESGLNSIGLICGLSADELTLNQGITNPELNAFYRNDLGQINVDIWDRYYKTLFQVNSAIEGLSASVFLTQSVKEQLLGEALFLRAFCYFYLVNLYNDVPLVISSDYSQNATLPRISSSQVLEQIISDLKDAELLLSPEFLKADASIKYTDGQEERVRPTKWAAKALLARVYLFTDDWTNAELAAGSVIDQSTRFKLTSLDSVFLKNSSEAIWQLQPVNATFNTEEAQVYILNTPPNSGKPVRLSQSLLSKFEPGDFRRTEWVHDTTFESATYFYPFKYRNVDFEAPLTEYQTVLRLAELYFIRAEARAQLNNLGASLSDLNVVRDRAGLSHLILTNQNDLLSAIYHERAVELFTEWGHRWLDLKRTDSIDGVMTQEVLQKGGAWNSYKQWFPIPINELKTNPNIIQNPGY